MTLIRLQLYQNVYLFFDFALSQYLNIFLDFELSKDLYIFLDFELSQDLDNFLDFELSQDFSFFLDFELSQDVDLFLDLELRFLLRIRFVPGSLETMCRICHGCLSLFDFTLPLHAKSKCISKKGSWIKWTLFQSCVCNKFCLGLAQIPCAG